MGKRMLIIDDDKAYSDGLFELFSDFTVQATFPVDNIFIVIDSFQPDIILIEYALPKKNGAELCLNIKLNPHTTNIPVLLISEYMVSDHVISACHCNQFISKPFQAFQFRMMVNSHCISSAYYE